MNFTRILLFSLPAVLCIAGIVEIHGTNAPMMQKNLFIILLKVMLIVSVGLMTGRPQAWIDSIRGCI